MMSKARPWIGSDRRVAALGVDVAGQRNADCQNWSHQMSACRLAACVSSGTAGRNHTCRRVQASTSSCQRIGNSLPVSSAISSHHHRVALRIRFEVTTVSAAAQPRPLCLNEERSA
jgi:hypothetical protein